MNVALACYLHRTCVENDQLRTALHHVSTHFAQAAVRHKTFSEPVLIGQVISASIMRHVEQLHMLNDTRQDLISSRQISNKKDLAYVGVHLSCCECFWKQSIADLTDL